MKPKNLFSINNFIYLICLGILSSCSYEKKDIPFCQYSDNFRDNNYSFLTQFPMSSWNNFIIDSKIKSGSIQAPLALNIGKIVLACDDGTLKFVENNKLTNTANTKENELICSNIAADKNENIYGITLNGNLHSFNKNGKVNWVVNFKDSTLKFQSFSDVLVTNSAIYVSSNSGLIAKVDFSGKILWQYKSDLSALDFSSTFENDDLVIGLTNSMLNSTDSLICFDRDGFIKWNLGFQNFRLIRGTSIYKDKIFIRGYSFINGEKSPKIICINQKGEILWENNVDVIPFYVSTDNYGNCFVAGFNTGMAEPLSGFYCFDKNGKLIWKNFIQATIVSELMISKKTIIFVGQTNAGLATFYLQNNDGINFKNITLGNFSMLYPQPAIANDGTIIFGSVDVLNLITISKTQLEKLLPF